MPTQTAKRKSKIKQDNDPIAVLQQEIEDLEDSLKVLRDKPKWQPKPGENSVLDELRNAIAAIDDEPKQVEVLERCEAILHAKCTELNRLQSERDATATKQRLDENLSRFLDQARIAQARLDAMREEMEKIIDSLDEAAARVDAQAYQQHYPGNPMGHWVNFCRDSWRLDFPAISLRPDRASLNKTAPNCGRVPGMM